MYQDTWSNIIEHNIDKEVIVVDRPIIKIIIGALWVIFVWFLLEVMGSFIKIFIFSKFAGGCPNVPKGYKMVKSE